MVGRTFVVLAAGVTVRFASPSRTSKPAFSKWIRSQDSHNRNTLNAAGIASRFRVGLFCALPKNLLVVSEKQPVDPWAIGEAAMEARCRLAKNPWPYRARDASDDQIAAFTPRDHIGNDEPASGNTALDHETRRRVGTAFTTSLNGHKRRARRHHAVIRPR